MGNSFLLVFKARLRSQAGQFLMLGGLPSSSGTTDRGEVSVLWDVQRGKEDAAEIYAVVSGMGPYLQQGLGRFVDRNDVGDLVPA